MTRTRPASCWLCGLPCLRWFPGGLDSTWSVSCTSLSIPSTPENLSTRVITSACTWQILSSKRSLETHRNRTLVRHYVAATKQRHLQGAKGLRVCISCLANLTRKCQRISTGHLWTWYLLLGYVCWPSESTPSLNVLRIQS